MPSEARRESWRRYRERNKDKVKDKNRRFSLKYYAKNKELIKERRRIPEMRLRQRLSIYRINKDEFANILIAQTGRCAICGSGNDDLQIDHDHRSGIVRGLLCGICNRGIGAFGEDVDRLSNAIQYLLNQNALDSKAN